MLLLHMRLPLIYYSCLCQDLGSLIAGLSCTDRACEYLCIMYSVRMALPNKCVGCLQCLPARPLAAALDLKAMVLLSCCQSLIAASSTGNTTLTFNPWHVYSDELGTHDMPSIGFSHYARKEGLARIRRESCGRRIKERQEEADWSWEYAFCASAQRRP